MLTDQKLREILKYVWNPKVDLTNLKNTEKLNQLEQQIYALLDSREGCTESLTEFLNSMAVKYFDSEVSREKSESTAKLIMDWYTPIPSRWTDFGRVKIQRSTSRFYEHDFFVYQIDISTEYIAIYYIGNNEIVIELEKIQLAEIEKIQLIEAIRDLIKPSILTFFDSSIHLNFMRSTWYE